MWFGISLAFWLFLGLVSAHWLLTLAFGLPPALMAWELWRDPVGRFTIDDRSLGFDSGRQARELDLASIARVRLLRRMDLSWLATFILRDGRKVRLPASCTPPGDRLEAELKARGVTVDRILFSLTG
jgi:hypothetical protein